MTTDTRDAETWAWRQFAFAHPVEAHESDPDRFWAFFQEMRPGVSREDMEALLARTVPAPPTDSQSESSDNPEGGAP